jgi:peptidoglycan/xylan/chitin deacetylase (PgdA/CDA1 family)
MYFVKTPSILKPLAKDLVWSIDTQAKEVFLTFDDGPTPEVTDHVLDLLAAYGAQATFFCLGKNVSQFDGLYSKIKSQGHATGNHTWNHPDGWKTDKLTYLKNVIQASEVIHSTLFRPPYGHITPMQTNALKSRYKIIMWDVLSADFDAQNTPQKCFENVRKNATSGSIIVFHDNLKSQKNMTASLEMSLKYFTDEGYTLRPIQVL